MKAIILSLALYLLLAPSSIATQHTLFVPYIIVTPVIEHGAGATYGNCARIAKAGIEWVYDWSVDPPDCPGVERVAMIWGAGNTSASIDPGVKWVLGFNEPEHASQANIKPADGAQLWRIVEQNNADHKLVSPSASLGWLTSWYNEYVKLYGEKPRIDAVGSHCYGAWSTSAAISECKADARATIGWAKQRGIDEVWITEFAFLPCWPDGETGSIEFMREMVKYYRADPNIARWAWFQTAYHGTEPWAFGPYCNTSLVDITTGQLTPMGAAYLDLAH